MTRRWVRTDDDRLSRVVTTYYRLGRNVKRVAEELDCSTANVYYLLRKATEAGLMRPLRTRTNVPIEPNGKPATGGDVASEAASDE